MTPRPDPLESALISAWNAGEPVEDEPQPAPATPAPMPGEAAIREQIRRVLAAADHFDYASLEPWDYQQQASVIVDMIRPLIVEAGTLRARVAELEAERDEVVVADFFQPGRTYTRGSHGRTATYRVTHITTSPDGEPCAVGWHQIEGYGSWRIWTDDDFHAWTEPGEPS